MKTKVRKNFEIKNSPKIQSAHAILLLSGSYLLQLRDNKPTIAAPGEWCLFGGTLQSKEMPQEAMKREIFEELTIELPQCKYLWYDDFYSSFDKDMIRIWFFEADVTGLWDNHKLREGKDAKPFQFKDTLKLKIPPVIRKAITRHNELKATNNLRNLKEQDEKF